jgi:hypothetical protein
VLKLTGNPEAQATVGLALFLDDESFEQLREALRTKPRRNAR